MVKTCYLVTATLLLSLLSVNVSAQNFIELNLKPDPLSFSADGKFLITKAGLLDIAQQRYVQRWEKEVLKAIEIPNADQAILITASEIKLIKLSTGAFVGSCPTSYTLKNAVLSGNGKRLAVFGWDGSNYPVEVLSVPDLKRVMLQTIEYDCHPKDLALNHNGTVLALVHVRGEDASVITLLSTLGTTKRVQLIHSVTPESVAELGGLKVGDIITHIDGIVTSDTARITALLQNGSKVRVYNILRDGKSLNIKLDKTGHDLFGYHYSTELAEKAYLIPEFIDDNKYMSLSFGSDNELSVLTTNNVFSYSLTTYATQKSNPYSIEYPHVTNDNPRLFWSFNSVGFTIQSIDKGVAPKNFTVPANVLPGNIWNVNAALGYILYYGLDGIQIYNYKSNALLFHIKPRTWSTIEEIKFNNNTLYFQVYDGLYGIPLDHSLKPDTVFKEYFTGFNNNINEFVLSPDNSKIMSEVNQFGIYLGNKKGETFSTLNNCPKDAECWQTPVTLSDDNKGIYLKTIRSASGVYSSALIAVEPGNPVTGKTKIPLKETILYQAKSGKQWLKVIADGNDMIALTQDRSLVRFSLEKKKIVYTVQLDPLHSYFGMAKCGPEYFALVSEDSILFIRTADFKISGSVLKQSYLSALTGSSNYSYILSRPQFEEIDYSLVKASCREPAQLQKINLPGYEYTGAIAIIEQYNLIVLGHTEGALFLTLDELKPVVHFQLTNDGKEYVYSDTSGYFSCPTSLTDYQIGTMPMQDEIWFNRADQIAKYFKGNTTLLNQTHQDWVDQLKKRGLNESSPPDFKK